MPNLTDADKVLRNDTGKDIVTKLDGILNAIEGTKQSLENLSDVNISNPSGSQALLYDATSERWSNESLGNAAFKDVDTTITSGSSNPVSADAVNTGLASKMNATDPAGTGSFSMNRNPNGLIGTNSFAEGANGTAAGIASHSEGNATSAVLDYAHAEGTNTIASGTASHAEGSSTNASGIASHAEGNGTNARGYYSHAEGSSTNAKGDYSHSEGNNTSAKHRSQHVFGEYNIEDTNSASSSSRGTYIEIVGNGTKNSARSNARTLDWDGNETLAGDLTYNGATSLTQEISNVNTRIDNLPEPMVFKGSLGTGGTITALPVDGSADKGDTYKVIEAGTYAGQSADIGDTFICDSATISSNTWTRIPSGDEPSGTVTSIQIQATSPIAINDATAITTSGTRTISHANSGASAGNYGDSSAQTPAVGGTFKVPYISVNATGHITNINAHNVTMPIPAATDVTYNNANSNLTATKVQSAIDELDTKKANNFEDEASGAIAEFKTSLTYPLLECICDFKATQDLHGQSAPYPAGGSRNKWAYGDQSVTGTYKAVELDTPLPAGTYTLSAKISSTYTTVAARFRKADASALVAVTLTPASPNRSSVVVELTEPAYFVYLYSANGQSGYTATWSDIQLESGNQATDYVPYSNICLITPVNSINVTRTGKNLVDIADRSNITTQTTLGTIVLKAGTYALSANVKNNGSISCYLTLRQGTTTKASITINASENTRKSTSFTLTETDNYTVVCSGASAGYNFDVSDLQLEAGSTATAYEAYNGVTKTLNLGGDYYGGEVDALSGEITENYGYVFSDGSDDTNWSYYSAYGSSYVFRYAYSGLKASGNISCNLLPKGNVGNDREIVSIAANGNFINFEISSTRLNGNTVADLMTFFASNNVQIVAELATPTQEQASNAIDLNTLYGDNCVFNDCGDTTVKFISNSIPALSVAYDNTVSGLSATNTQYAIDEIRVALGYWLTGTLVAGQTTLVISNAIITTDSIVDNVYVPDTYFGVNPTNISVATGSVTLTFPVQSNDIPVKVRIL